MNEYMFTLEVWITTMVKIVINSEKVGLFRDGVDGWRSRWCDLFIPAISGYLIQMIVPGGKRYSSIRAWLSRRESSDTITGREDFSRRF